MSPLRPPGSVRPRLGKVFEALGLSVEWSRCRTAFGRAVLSLGGSLPELTPFEALGFVGVTGVSEAWEALCTAGLCPTAWAHAPRTFMAPPERRIGMPVALAPDPSPTPPTLRACVAFASNPQGLARAEELACAWASSLARYGVITPPAIRWRLTPSLTHTLPRGSLLPDTLAMLPEEALAGERAIRDDIAAGHYALEDLSPEALTLAAPPIEALAWWL